MAVDVLKQIRTLLEIAERKNDVNEAASAAAIAQSLMMKHNIERADLEIAGLEQEENIIGEFIDDSSSGQRRISWHGQLVNSLCKAFDCTCLWHGTNLKVIGRAGNVQTVRYMFSYLKNEIERLMPIYKEREGVVGRTGAKTWSNNFKIGAVHAIHSRLLENKRTEEKKYSDTNSCALLFIKKDEERIGNYLSHNHPNLRERKVTYRANASGYMAGQEAGQTIEFNNNSRGLKARSEQLDG